MATDSNCVGPGIDPEWWDTARPLSVQRRAVGYCQTCPVQTDCVLEAYRQPPVGLIQGGYRWDRTGKPHTIR